MNDGLSLAPAAIALQRLIPASRCPTRPWGIDALAAFGMSPQQIAAVLDLLVRDRAQRPLPEGLVDLVNTGPRRCRLQPQHWSRGAGTFCQRHEVGTDCRICDLSRAAGISFAG